MYINPKGMIGMLVTNRHVWGHAYGHDNYPFVFNPLQGSLINASPQSCYTPNLLNSNLLKLSSQNNKFLILQLIFLILQHTNQGGQMQLMTIELLNPCCLTHLVTRDVQLQSLVV
jgi:hypothetical protein